MEHAQYCAEVDATVCTYIRRYEMPKPNGFLHQLCALRHRFHLCAFSEEENQLGKDGRVARIKEIRIRVSYHCARRHGRGMCACQSRIYGHARAFRNDEKHPS